MAETIWNSAVSVYHFMMDNLVVINILLSLVIVFFQRRSPQTVWTWLLLLYFIPILGFVLYLLIGQDFHKSRMFKAKEIEGEIKYAVRRQEETIYRRRLRLTNPAVARYRDLILYNLEAGQAVLTDNNDVRIYTDGKEKFKALLEEMQKAKKYIHFQYYIIRNDELWQHIEPVLIKRAKEGVEVRILFDSMGCRGMHNRDWERLEKEGIHVAEFSGAVWKSSASNELPESPQDCRDRRQGRICGWFQCRKGISGTGQKEVRLLEGHPSLYRRGSRNLSGRTVCTGLELCGKGKSVSGGYLI